MSQSQNRDHRDGSRTMIGNLSMNNNKIIKVGTPTDNKDAAKKSMWMINPADHSRQQG